MITHKVMIYFVIDKKTKNILACSMQRYSDEILNYVCDDNNYDKYEIITRVVEFEVTDD